jgi:hypothetical protein
MIPHMTNFSLTGGRLDRAMRDNEERPPEESESGLSSVVWGWALWAAIILVFAVWGGMRALMPDEASIIAGIESIAPAAGPPGAPESAPRPHPASD